MRENVRICTSNKELHEAMGTGKYFNQRQFTILDAAVWWVLLGLTGLFWFWVAGCLGIIGA